MSCFSLFETEEVINPEIYLQLSCAVKQVQTIECLFKSSACVPSKHQETKISFSRDTHPFNNFSFFKKYSQKGREYLWQYDIPNMKKF